MEGVGAYVIRQIPVQVTVSLITDVQQVFNILSRDGDIVEVIKCLSVSPDAMQLTICNILKVGSSPGNVWKCHLF